MEEALPGQTTLVRNYKIKIKADVIVLAPPRKGCAPEALNAIAEMKPERILYVSFNPVTLAWDLGILKEKGFEIVEVQLVAMFP